MQPFNGTDVAIRIRWTRCAADGTVIDNGSRDLGPYGNTQLNSVLADVLLLLVCT